jgi:hypothetical protein
MAVTDIECVTLVRCVTHISTSPVISFITLNHYYYYYFAVITTYPSAAPVECVSHISDVGWN